MKTFLNKDSNSFRDKFWCFKIKTTFNNISDTPWWLVLLKKVTRVPTMNLTQVSDKMMYTDLIITVFVLILSDIHVNHKLFPPQIC